MEEEAAIEHRSRSKMLYINLAGNQLRALRERAGGGRGTAPGGGRGTAPEASAEWSAKGLDHSQQPGQQNHTLGAKRGARLAPPPGKARKLEVAGSDFPLDTLMPTSAQTAVGGVDKPALSSSGEGGPSSTVTSNALGKVPVSAKLRGKSAKRKAAPQGPRPVNRGADAAVKSNEQLHEMFGSDSDDEGWVVHNSWDQAMTVSDKAISKGNRKIIAGKKSKTKAVSQVRGTRNEMGKATPNPRPTGKTNWSVVPTCRPEELTGGRGSTIAAYVL